MDGKRLVACGSIAVAGVGLAVPPTTRLAEGGESLLGVVLASLGIAISLVLVAAAVGLYVSDVATGHTLLVAGWNALGVVVLGSVLLLAAAYLPQTPPTFIVTDVLAVSAFAHVLIGVNDVRRIRTRDVAERNERLAVLHRLFRHNLRTEAQALIGYGDLLDDHVDDEGREYAAQVRDHARRIGSMNDEVNHIYDALEVSEDATGSMAAADLVATAVDDVRAVYPDAAITVDAPADLHVRGGDTLTTALAHLVENAVEHNDADRPTVTVSATSADGWVDLTVTDNGPGIPEMERSVVTGETEVTPLNHSRGLGLWVTRWITTSYDGTLLFGDNSTGGNATVRLRRAT